MKEIIGGMLFIVAAIMLPFDTLFIDFNQFTAGQLSLLKTVLVAAGVVLIAEYVMRGEK